MKFIKLVDKSGDVNLINVAHIIDVVHTNNKTALALTEGNFIIVDHTMEEIEEILKELN